jgi:lipopolysaccharide/colanic/teichoic acid biosynthesis glycosyltransferase
VHLKRAFDVAGSAAALALLLPVFVVIACTVWIESGRPVFFAQIRVGRGFRPFRMWKFRSMRPDPAGPSITVAGDGRVTRVGAVLRALKLDELPQFWNVLKGDMSLVGPRPEVPAYVGLYPERYAAVLAVRPGITDLASLAYRHEEKLLAAEPDPHRFYCEVLLPEKLRLADQYIQQQSFGLDVRILIRTFAAALNLKEA